MREWLAMRPEDFDTDVAPVLFDVERPAPPAVDPCGTGDLLDEIDPDAR